jgi:benzoate transport
LHDTNLILRQGPSDPRDVIAALPLTAFQLGVIGVLFGLNALDGFDVLAIAFAAPGISRDWAISPAALGFVISLGLFATGFGSLFVAPFADKVGRRPMIFCSLAAMAIGMLVCAIAKDLRTLSAGRLLTGIGVGALVPCISALSAEYANRRYRDLAVMVMAVGFPFGGFVGGALSAWLLRHFHWNSIFIAGSVATGAMMLAPLLFVPESIEHLILRPSSKSLQRVNDILRRLRQPPMASLPAAESQIARRAGVDFFMRPSLILLALLITVIYGLHNATLYYALNWIPKIVVDLGLPQSRAATVAAWCSGGGILGALGIAVLSVRFNVAALTVSLLFGAAGLLCAFARTPADMALLIAAAAALGVFLYGAQASLYALMTQSFPVHVRATGVGFVTGIGRLGGVISPIVSGHLLGVGLRYAQVSTVMALGSLLGAAILLLHLVRKAWNTRKQNEPPGSRRIDEPSSS